MGTGSVTELEIFSLCRTVANAVEYFKIEGIKDTRGILHGAAPSPCFRRERKHAGSLSHRGLFNREPVIASHWSVYGSKASTLSRDAATTHRNAAPVLLVT